jgi:hypothetical protein
LPLDIWIYNVNLVVTNENSALGSIKAVTDKLNSMLEKDWWDYKFITESVERVWSSDKTKDFWNNSMGSVMIDTNLDAQDASLNTQQ